MELAQFFQQQFPHYAMQIFRLCTWLALLTAIIVPLEHLFAIHPHKVFRKALLTDLGYYFFNSLMVGLLLSLPLALLARGAHDLMPSQYISAVTACPLWVRTLAALVVGEIGFYWGHRWSHEIPLLWRFHAVHHSAEQIDFLVNTRAHPIDLVFTRLCGTVPLYVLGLAAPVRGSASLIPLLVLVFGTAWGFFLHANVRWRFGVLEKLIATPAFHHWHHTNDGLAYLNKNYAPMLPWLDHLFGTLYLPKDQHPVRYGIDQPVSPHFLGQLLQPFLVVDSEVSISPKQNHSQPIFTQVSETDRKSGAIPIV